MDERFALIHLNRLSKIGAILAGRLISRYGSAKAAMERDPWEWHCELQIKLDSARMAFSPQSLDATNREIEQSEKSGVSILTWDEPEYPSDLKSIPIAPPVLYLKGRMDLLQSDRSRFAIVGTRTPTSYGKIQSERFGKALTEAGFILVSGFARGVDAETHQAALNASGPTIAVIASGLLNVYPRDRPIMQTAIEERGLFISEFALTYPPLKENFPRRNRIISGLSRGVLDVEAAARSGSLITANWAVEQGREVFALPGRIDSPMSCGCHALLKVGAQLVENPVEILESLGFSTLKIGPKEENSTDPIVNILRSDMKTADQLCSELSQSADVVLDRLLELEIEGRIRRCPGGLYRLLQ